MSTRKVSRASSTFITQFSFGSGKATLTLPFRRTVVRFLGGNVPDRGDQPTEVPLEGKRSRAKQVQASRKVATRLFDIIGKCMGYVTKPAPKRELLLEEGMGFWSFLRLPLG